MPITRKKPFQLKLKQIKIPKINTIQLLYTLLLIAIFLIGYLVATVQYLGKNNAQTAPTAPTAAGPTPAPHMNVALGHFPLKGNINAKITIVEFADLRCPFCKQFFDSTEPQLISDYVNTGKVQFAFRQFPFLGPSSTIAANAAECANDQGKFWDFHDYMYKNQPDETDTSMYNTDSLTTVAQNLGMDPNQFRSCLSANQDATKATGDMADGQKAGVTGTPTFFINGYQVVGALPYASFQKAIDCVSNNSGFSVTTTGTVTCSKT